MQVNFTAVFTCVTLSCSRGCNVAQCSGTVMRIIAFYISFYRKLLFDLKNDQHNILRIFRIYLIPKVSGSAVFFGSRQETLSFCLFVAVIGKRIQEARFLLDITSIPPRAGLEVNLTENRWKTISSGFSLRLPRKNARLSHRMASHIFNKTALKVLGVCRGESSAFN